MVRRNAARVYLAAERKLPDGLHDARIFATQVVGPFQRCSLWLQVGRITARIDFELLPHGCGRCEASAFVDRLAAIAGIPKLRDTSELHGKTIGIRIDRRRFAGIESPRPRKPQPAKEGDE